MNTAIINLERTALNCFCDHLPEPLVARPVVTARRGNGLTLALEYEGHRVMLMEDGKPFKFCTLDDVIAELSDVPNVDCSHLVIDTGSYWH